MDISVVRDFVIVIGGFLLLVVIILAGILGFLIYRDIQSLASSVKSTLVTARQLGSNFKQAASFIKIINSLFRQEGKTRVENKPSGSPTS